MEDDYITQTFRDNAGGTSSTALYQYLRTDRQTDMKVVPRLRLRASISGQTDRQT